LISSCEPMVQKRLRNSKAVVVHVVALEEDKTSLSESLADIEIPQMPAA